MHAGMKFWKTGKIVKAISEADYQRLQRSRGRNDPGPTPGPSNAGASKPAMYVVSDSDSNGPIIPLLMKRRKIFHVPSPPGSDSDFSTGPYDRIRPNTSMEKMLKDVVSMVKDVRDKVEKAVHTDPEEKVVLVLKEIFTCLICKQISTELSRPVIPPCCKSIICCYDCINQWISNSPICPHIVGALSPSMSANFSQ